MGAEQRECPLALGERVFKGGGVLRVVGRGVQLGEPAGARAFAYVEGYTQRLAVWPRYREERDVGGVVVGLGCFRPGVVHG